MFCLICHQPIVEIVNWSRLFILTQQEQNHICLNCKQKLEPITGEQCRICSRPFAKLDNKFRKQDLCNDCFNWEQKPEWQGLLAQNISLFYYNDFLKEILAKYKFRGDHQLVYIFTSYMKNKFKQTFPQQNPPIIIPIPLSAKRHYERGFNQAHSLAHTLSLPIDDILQRTHSEKQSKKNRTERISTISPFQLKPTHQPQKYENKLIILIDDIYTTGTTLRQAAKTLRPLSLKTIYSFTLARS